MIKIHVYTATVFTGAEENADAAVLPKSFTEQCRVSQIPSM